ncbi:MAG: hypothetical protein K9I29_00565 [Bacteroidales bacterium]|nr:hypothetical protein [Bacteroidales bacterium]MCF8326758.1 hypothetical protein [Bacteroidales bacterium]
MTQKNWIPLVINPSFLQINDGAKPEPPDKLKEHYQTLKFVIKRLVNFHLQHIPINSFINNLNYFKTG